MTRFEEILSVCQEPRTAEAIAEAINGDLRLTRIAIYNLVSKERLVNLKAGLYRNTRQGGVYIAAELAGNADIAAVKAAPRVRFDASALVAAWRPKP